MAGMLVFRPTFQMSPGLMVDLVEPVRLGLMLRMLPTGGVARAVGPVAECRPARRGQAAMPGDRFWRPAIWRGSTRTMDTKDLVVALGSMVETPEICLGWLQESPLMVAIQSGDFPTHTVVGVVAG